MKWLNKAIYVIGVNHFLEERKKNWVVVVLLLIVAGGIFLRSYQFHNWLVFNLDQVRDATVVGQVLRGEAAWPLLGPHMNHTEFQLGPAYYYFQIFSAKIFGLNPDSLAYPDFLFSVLAIPLLYFFLKRYLSAGVSLALVGLFTVSFYAITYARFAWNPNSIPFFIILYLLALYEFVIAKEKTKWIWIVLAGIAVGVGVQLHAILLILLPINTLVVFCFLVKNNRTVWVKCLAVILIAFVLNTGQVVSEIQTHFSNSKLFLSTLAGKSSDEKSGLLKKLGLDVGCHIQSNATIAAAFASQQNCDLLNGKKSIWHLKKSGGFGYLFTVIFCYIFSILGYGALVYFFRREQDIRKKYFLGLILLYASLSFLVLLPVGNDLRPRYFIHIFFLPFFFIGLLYHFFLQIGCLRKYANVFLLIIVVFFTITNGIAMRARVQELSSKSSSEADSEYDSVILGEIEPMVDYIISQSSSDEAAITGKATYVGTFFEPLAFIGSTRGITLVRTNGKENAAALATKPVFFVGSGLKNKNCVDTIEGYAVADCKIFGQVAIYKLQE